MSPEHREQPIKYPVTPPQRLFTAFILDAEELHWPVDIHDPTRGAICEATGARVLPWAIEVVNPKYKNRVTCPECLDLIHA